MDVTNEFKSIISILKDSKCKFSQSEYSKFEKNINMIECLHPEFNESVPIIVLPINKNWTKENKIDHENHPAWPMLSKAFETLSFDDFNIEEFKYHFLQMYHVHKVRNINYFEQLNLNESFLMSLYFCMYH